ncbi:MAG: hypothetical protein AAGA23_12975 [Pseudomonadota bacterium]
MGWLPVEEVGNKWVLGLVGLSFILAGLIMLVPPGDRRADALAGLLLMAFSLVGFSIALGMDGEGSAADSISFPQLLVGLGSLLSLLISLWAIRRWLRPEDST